jgi:hypothetical protein
MQAREEDRGKKMKDQLKHNFNIMEIKDFCVKNKTIKKFPNNNQ